jgi:hypothetical protein
LPDGSRSERELTLAGTWRRLGPEQRVAAVGALLLIGSTFGPFSFVEAAEVLIGLGVLLLLRKRAEGREFHLPFGDGTVIAAAGLWAGLLILIRLFDRPAGQAILALACAALIAAAGIRERAKRPADDLPAVEAPDDWVSPARSERPRPRPPRPARPGSEAPTEPLGREAAARDLGLQEPPEAPTEPLPRPPEDD